MSKRACLQGGGLPVMRVEHWANVLMADGTPSGGTPPLPIAPRLRILFPGGLRLGPGKIELLAAIGETGSISAAGRALGMSYRRAWLLIDEANRMFTAPLVLASAGGSHGGGAQLTDLGRSVIAPIAPRKPVAPRRLRRLSPG